MIVLYVIIIIVILVLLFLIYIYYLRYQKKIYLTTPSNTNKVVLLKTHIWNDSLEKYAIKLYHESAVNQIDFFVLMHTEDGKLPNKIKDPNIKSRTIKFTEDEIRNIYKEGFFSMWLNNHWILMWFYKKNLGKYEYYWTIEYDTRISGNSSIIWAYQGTEDFVYPYEPWQDPKWLWRNHYVGNKLKDKDKYYGYLQITRYSSKFLSYLDQCFASGENGQDEMILFSLFKRGNFTGTSKVLSSLIKNSWSVDPNLSESNKKLYKESETRYQVDKTNLVIFHPIKDI